MGRSTGTQKMEASITVNTHKSQSQAGPLLEGGIGI